MVYQTDNGGTDSDVENENVNDDICADDSLLPPDVQILKWIFCVQHKEDNSSDQWEKAQLNLEKSKKKICRVRKPYIRRYCCGCCQKGPCEREQAVKELFDFLKRMKQNITTSSCNAEGDASKCKYGSVQPAFVLAHLSTKLSEFQKRLKKSNCSRNSTCRLRRLIKYSQRSIVIQCIQGPSVNDLFTKTVRDVACIERLMKEVVPDAPKGCNCGRKLDRATPYTKLKRLSRTILDSFYNNNRENCMEYNDITDDTGIESLPEDSLASKSTDSLKEEKVNVKSYNPKEEVEPITKEELESNNIEVKDKHSQTDKLQSLTFENKEQLEVTALYVKYSRNRYINEIDQLPKLAINKIEDVYYTTEHDLDTNITNVTNNTQTYATRVDDFNVTTETITKENFENLNIKFSNDKSETKNSPGNSPFAEEVLSNIKRDIFLYGEKLATLFFNARNESV
ncbi:hypothetical protein O3M35_013357 [Rhynocoris fuscipes]|uniref:Uncharacterized protein n=1 Tax=Rhynocoris fuscipes TaxID=488301 RepID=A0AAW1CF42_9HEMI